jgi:diketogulonate reductase-like aldo/keto reductase
MIKLQKSEVIMNLQKLTDAYELPNGVKIPCIGFGTWQVKDEAEAVSSVKAALQSGYRHIDTAAAYHNEDSVGRGIKESGVPRGEIFIASKLHNTMHGYENTHAGFSQTIKDLGVDYLDLYLIHWPNPLKYRDDWQGANAGTWKAFEELYKDGKIRAMGVSNFHAHHIDALLDVAKVPPQVNQLRLCPGEPQTALVEYCRAKGLFLEAYSPLGTGKTFEVPELKSLAAKYHKSIAQICVRWSLQHGYLPLPKSVTPQRIKENAAVFDFTLAAADMAAIDALEGCCDYSRDPDTITF